MKIDLISEVCEFANGLLERGEQPANVWLALVGTLGSLGLEMQKANVLDDSLLNATTEQLKKFCRQEQ